MGSSRLRIQEPGIIETLGEHERRLREQEQRGDEGWIYVGTVGLDGVDALITPDSPPFQPPWTNSLGDDAPVSFRRTLNGWLHLRGGFAGGLNGATIFVLPPGFRPEYRQPLVIPTATVSHYATVVVNTNGAVVFGSVV